MGLAIVIIFYFLIIIFDFIPFIKKGIKKGKLVYIIIMIITFSILSINSIGIKVPSPARLINNLIDIII